MKREIIKHEQTNKTDLNNISRIFWVTSMAPQQNFSELKYLVHKLVSVFVTDFFSP